MAVTVYLDKGGQTAAGVFQETGLKLAQIAAGAGADVTTAIMARGLSKTDGKLKMSTGYVRKTDLQRMDVQTVAIPQNFAGLEAVDVPTRLMEQYFEIVDVDEQDGEVVIRARHLWYENLQNFTLWQPDPDTTYNCAAVCKNVLDNAVFPVNFEVATDCEDTLPGTDLDFERKNIVECFLDPENGICKMFGLSMIRDNARFYVLKNVGYDRGFVVEAGKNLLGVDRIENKENLATRVAPYGKDSKGKIIWLDYNGKKYIDSQYINNYREPMLELYDTGLVIGKDGTTADNIQGKLLTAAQKRFSEDKVDQPEVTMTVEFVSLGDTEEYKQYRDLDKVYLYDIITIKDPERGYNYAAQVIGVEHDILTGRLNSVTIGSLQQADQSRKIAVWQVPEIDGTNIRLLSIQAGAFAPGAVNTDDIAPYTITADLIQAGAVITEKLAANSITTEKLGAESVTAGKIAAGSVETEKLAAFAVTATKIAAGAVETDKLAAGAITADKISTTDIDAINAVLGTANIANARIAAADINFAHIKDLNAESAYFGQTVFDEAVGGKLYVPRLAVGYAQMLGATISDLVIQASNDLFYKLDVDLAGNVTATQMTPTAQEIEQGYTNDGRTIYMGTDILATDLNTENIYASHGLMDEITANIINVDKLFAREATISKINAMDLSSNTYIRSTIGNWTGASTITQTINSLDSRISSLGYGTVYFQPDEPDHAELVQGDIWIQSTPAGTWATVAEDYASWQAIYDTVGTWQTVGGIPKMYTWDGRYWQEMYDAMLPQTLETEIQQLANQITLLATKTEVNELAGDITEFYAQLTIQAQEIQSAVSAVNLKAASYVMREDPRTAYTVSVGDIWIKSTGAKTWNEVLETMDSWNQVLEFNETWLEFLGESTYIWNGTEWIETSDRASEIYQSTLIDQTINEVSILAEAAAVINDTLIRTQAEIRVTNDSILQEVQRAQTAENSKLDKTSTYQTADAIVNAAQSYVNGILGSEAQIELLATGITQYVADHAYGLQSGIEILAAGIEISGGKYIKIKTGGSFVVQSGNFGVDTNGNVTIRGKITAAADSVIAGWTLANNNMHSGTGGSYVALASSGTYAMWAGSETAASAPWRVKFDGTQYITKLMAVGENGTETEVNLRTAGLWKLSYQTIKRWAVSGGTVTIETTGGNINFNSAAGVVLSGGWTDGWTKYTVTAKDGAGNVVGTKSSGAVTADKTNAQIKSAIEESDTHSTTLTIEADGEDIVVRTINASGVYADGKTEGIEEYYNSSYWAKATAENNWTPQIPNSTNTGSEDWTDSGASDAYAAATPESGTASGRSGSSYAWTFRILKADGSGKNLTIDCSSIYSDARQGYTQGIFSQYSGAQLYTMGQHGPERYTGTLYVKS